MPDHPNSDIINIMFWGWLKGLISSALLFVGFLVFVGGFLFMEEDTNITMIIVGLIMCAVGSYLKYVSKQTVKNIKK